MTFYHHHAATRSGLGEFGFNNIVLTREYGPRKRFNSIITEAELKTDPLITESICLRDECGFLCLKACFMEAIIRRDDQEDIDYRSVDKDIEEEQIFIDTLTKTDPKACKRRRDEDKKSPVCGDCLRVCPVPEIRELLPDHLEELIAEKMPERINWNESS